jgi:glycosyltransferase involved in cell wall biosynthesis
VNFGTAAPPDNAEGQREVFEARFPQTRGKKLVLFLSRIHEKKACDLVLHAFAAVAAERPQLHLVMAGPEQPAYGDMLRGLAARLGIAQRITWTGMLSGADKWGAYRAAGVFMLPSHQENFGIVVAEAMACGVPVLISNKVNIWREVAEDEAGFVAEDDVPGATGLLKQWLALSDDERSRMSSNALRCFAQRFEIDHAAASVAQALSSRISGLQEAA